MTALPGTSFQTATGWAAELDVRADAAIVYSTDKERMDSWARRGYIVQTMGGFRTGDAYIKEHPEEGQTIRDGTILTCGPGSYYMVPTPARIRAMSDFFVQAVKNGSTAVIPEEPEFFALAGYSQSFKDEWHRYYGEPWQDPATSHDTRIRAEQLKGKMEYRMIQSIFDAVKAENASVTRMVAHHSPVNYHGWGISFPFNDFATMPDLQEAIGQVWTGTARTPCMFRGESRERTFENALLEYSSLVELYRGRGKRLWFLADPLEDNPDRTMEDYRSNYAHTLVASLMFPEVNSYELLPWPDRIYSRIPAEYGTELGCVFNALREISRIPEQPEPYFAIGVLIGDSAAYQRADPDPNGLDGFYGLTLPLLYEGIPVRVAPIERVGEPGFLRSFRTLLLSYDFFKPMTPRSNTALAQWVREGGKLILVGGSNAYNNADQWWRQQGYASPDEHLLRALGLSTKRAGPGRETKPEFKVVLAEDRDVRDNSNLAEREIPLPEDRKAGQPVLVRFGDSQKAGGWGAYLKQVRIASEGREEVVRPGTAQEQSMLVDDMWTFVNADGARFADGLGAFTYLVPDAGPGTKVYATVGNQFEVSVAAVPARTTADDVRSAFGRLGTRYTLTDPKMNPQKAADGAASSFTASIGRGTLVFLGDAAADFARDAGGARALVEEVGQGASAQERMSWKFSYSMDRGPYRAVHPMGGTVTLGGTWIDLLNNRLPLLTAPKVGPGESRILRKVSTAREPELLAGSYECRIVSSTAESMAVRNIGPVKVPGALRVHTAERKVWSVSCTDAGGKPVVFEKSEDAGTVYITFPGSPDGVTVTIRWE